MGMGERLLWPDELVKCNTKQMAFSRMEYVVFPKCLFRGFWFCFVFGASYNIVCKEHPLRNPNPERLS